MGPGGGHRGFARVLWPGKLRLGFYNSTDKGPRARKSLCAHGTVLTDSEISGAFKERKGFLNVLQLSKVQETTIHTLLESKNHKL